MLSRLLSDIDRLFVLDSLCPHMRKNPRFFLGYLAQERRHARIEAVAPERLAQREAYVCRNVSVHD
jgi:hypothetical protein